MNSKGLEDSSPVSPDSENLNFKEFDIPSPVVKISELTGASSNFAAAGNAQTNIDLDNPFIRGALKLFLPAISKAMDLGIQGRGAVNYLDPGEFHRREKGRFSRYYCITQRNLRILTHVVHSSYCNIGRYKWWSPTTGGDPVDLAFVDGGMYDNLGALAVLRRGMSTVMICDACDSDLLNTPDKDLPSKYYDVAFLFGVGESYLPTFLQEKSYTDTCNERSQVFEKEEFMNLINDMRALQREGKPLVVRKTLKLIPNKYAGIFESREVDMIFCFNGKVKEFDDRAEKPKSVSDDFPYINTLQCNYSTEEVNRLSSICSYSLVEGLKNVNFDIDQVERLSP